MTTQFSLNVLRFEDARQNVINFLKDNNEYAGEFNFDASNLGYIIDIVAYYNMLQSYRDTLRSNNIFIDTTEIRKNAISIAKGMGYRPKRKVSSRFTGTIEYYGNTGTLSPITFVEGDTITIPARTQFTSGDYTFTNKIPITLAYVNDILLSGDFIAYEGTFRNVRLYGTGEKYQTYVIPSEKVENESLSVYVRTTNTSVNDNVKWEQADSFFTTTNDLIYFVEEDIVNEYRPKIVFGDDIIGLIPADTELITIEYLETVGDDANGQTSLSFVGTPSATITQGSGSTFTFDSSGLTINIPANQVSYGGKDNETLEGIQFNAPRFYMAGGRGVTKEDLKVLLSEYDSMLKYLNVVGGNILFPDDSTKLGVGYITAVSYFDEDDEFLLNEDIYLSEIEENQILPLLANKTVLGTIRRFMKPTYIYMTVNPYIEVPSSYSNEEIESTISAAYNSIIDYRDDNLKGLGISFRSGKLISSLTNTTGVVSSDLEIMHYFAMTGDSFYNSRSSMLNLPVLYQKSAAGVVLYDDNNNPLRTNFIKKREDIIDDENEGLTDDLYTQLTLPIDKSSIYGSLRHRNSNRYLYNIDISKVEVLTFKEEGSVGEEFITYSSKSFIDENGITRVSNLYENGTDSWQIQLNGRHIAQIRKSSGIYSIYEPDATFLSDDIGVISETINGITTWLTIEEITEVDENLNVETYYSVSFLLNNTTYTDVRIYAETKLGDAIFDPSIFEWAWSNLVTFLDDSNGNVTFAQLTSTAGDEENFLTVVNADGTNDIILSVKNLRGTFTLNNFNNRFLETCDQRNDFKLYQNYTFERNDISETDSAWQASKSYVLENTILSSSDYICECTTAGTSGTSEPTWPTTYRYGTTVSDGSVVWTLVNNTVDGQYISYEFSTMSTPTAAFEQTIKLNEYKSFQLTFSSLATNTEIASTSIGRMASKWFHLYSANDETHYYVWLKNGVHEKSTFTCIADSGGSLNNDYISFEVPNEDTSNIYKYYVWFNVNGAGTDPSPAGADFGIEVPIATGTTAGNVAIALETYINAADIDVEVTVSTNDVTIENDYPGEVDNTLSVNSTGFTGLTRDATGVNAVDPQPDVILGETWSSIPVLIRTDDTYLEIASKMNVVINSYDDFESTVSSDVITVTLTSKGKNTVSYGDSTNKFNELMYRSIFGTDYSSLSSPYNTSSLTTTTGFLYSVDTSVSEYGGYNIDVNLERIEEGDYLVIENTTSVLNSGTFLVKSLGTETRYDLYTVGGVLKSKDVGSTCVPTGTDVIKTTTVPDGTIVVYNKGGIETLDGVGSIKHYKVVSGTYGHYIVYALDLFHDSSIGKLNYESGELFFNDEVKGYIDYETSSSTSNIKGYFSNQYVMNRNIKSVFDNYGKTWDTSTNKVDIIKITSIDHFNNNGVYLGAMQDFDTLFNQCLQINITNPIIKK